MSVILLIFLFFQNVVASDGYSKSPPSESDTDDANNRTTLDIIWSCLTTIFACSWIAVHSNIPSPEDKWGIVLARRLKLMFWAIIAPEMILAWSIRQWLGARYIAREYRDAPFRWTVVHGHFIQMGGFMLYQEDTPLRTLSIEELHSLFLDGKVEWPRLSAEAIVDKSKGDFLAKGLVILQTGWFVVQCISRGAEGLVLTALEIVTLAFCTLNGLMYIFWWNKPLDVQCAIPVYLKDESVNSYSDAEKAVNETPPLNPAESPDKNQTLPIPVAEDRFIQHLYAMFCEDLRKKGLLWIFYYRLLYCPFVYPLLQMAYFHDMKTGAKRVPTFHVITFQYGERRKIGAALLVLFSASLFGAIHCIARTFDFPSATTQMMWRVSSLVIACFPLGSVFLAGLQLAMLVLTKKTSQDGYSTSERLVLWLRSGIFVGYIAIYVMARLVLLFIALATLRNLPSGAFRAIEWTDFIPHL
ncbi:hypothetical protein BDQ12DRAFT_727377 [Crucibulum laeve]|uniref:Uncharacterized protein n=1 Tax=Crucibulum laeve TaxID=68775 RepID=A0A5C3LNE4_9AGAR|nr:hypothetical protein BDQ12DRAFT_727377 [Crucibulum laeve]